ncbi:MAG: HAMP domain-containing histidine kinase [Parvibaculum sp.]|uniref:sensor histidine kinase n=1 Tax=Parvibaculum sp. TaxID=2024848 RepID=UPI0025F96D42|nr:HAMP domain-containing sensor histidine kinase [Parvibaculum sp.]MCE9649733.1 HAMP domain-containing histidine kinase [Parvibaculum sp.]
MAATEPHTDERTEMVLRDGWTVFRGEILPAAQFANTSCALPGSGLAAETVSLPDVWGPALTTDVSTGHGVATYCVELALPQVQQFLALRMGTTRSVYAIYALTMGEDGHETVLRLHQNGDPAHASEIVANNPTSPVVTLPFGVQRIKLVIQLANYVHKQGGIVDVPRIDYLQHLDSQQRRESALPTALVLVLLLVSFATLTVGRSHDSYAGHVIFAWLSAASAFRVLFVSNLVWDYFPAFSEARKYDLEYLSLFMIAPAYYAFICYLFRNGKVLRIDKTVYAVSAAFCLFALFVAPFCAPGTITLLREPFQLLWVVIALVLGFTIFKSLLTKPAQKIDALIVLVAAMTMIAYEIVSSLKIIGSSLELSQFLIVLVTALHARAFVYNFRRVAGERDSLTQNLKIANADLEARAKALSRAVAQAEEASHAKTEFLATMSHELRTPLNAVIGFSEMMKLEVFGPLGARQYVEYARDINSSGTHLLSLVNDILDLSRVESGNDELLEEKLDMAQTARLILSFVKPQAEKCDVTCRLEAPGDLPLLVADERKVKQILINLVSTAIKFNVAGGTVVVRLAYDRSAFSIRVVDTGIGMREEDIPKALARFGQVDSHLNRKYEGLGIGLSIVQVLADQHGGTIAIESAPGAGTTVTVLFPIERCAMPVQRAS